ncbi:transcription elongation factor GreB [Umboniibacter marinipuniceus]|uniref:Transcription elongation factor GreB n=1 Tax=Umboniibacter marinipuniceus TaxID=569599 RepID=A0A3M0A790_9GAMM|nr:transcription elongation factor GreB [Umboniibacter marinipuniceus]RMA79409.1 transcription elongation factor GreB [Umboniibacter marinipuniceus]
MGRWRPPSEKKSNYITAEGAELLTQELRQLWKVERPEVTAVVSAAAKNGDRSENGDYIYGKKRLREIDSRVRYLTKRLDAATIVDRKPSDSHRVFFGAWVTVEDDDGNESRYRIVGPDEFDRAPNFISMDGPLAKALLGKHLDDEVNFATVEGERTVAIIAIEY